MRLRGIVEYLVVSETQRYKLPVTLITTNSIVLTAANKDSYPRFVNVLRTDQAIDSLNQTGYLIGLPQHNVAAAVVVLSQPNDEEGEIAIWNLRRFRDRITNEVIETTANTTAVADIFGATFVVERRIEFEDSAAKLYHDDQRIEYIWIEAKNRYVRREPGTGDATTAGSYTDDDDVICRHFDRANGE